MFSPANVHSDRLTKDVKGCMPSLASAVHVWSVDLQQAEFSPELVEETLSKDELARAARFHFDRDQRRFVTARTCLRHVLAAYAEIHPAQLQFSYSPYGKPSVVTFGTDLRFNVSHSDERGLIAVTRNREVGVDVERIRSDVETEELSNRFFSSQEAERLRAVPPELRVASFFRIWTCKEAFLKARGLGLSVPLDSFDVDEDLSRPARLLATRPCSAEADAWSLAVLDWEPGYAAALAVSGPMVESILHPWSELSKTW